MHPAPVPFARISHVVLLLLILAALASAQKSNVPPLIVQAVDDSQLTTLKGNTHPLARAQFDRGAAPPDLPMRRMLLVLKRSRRFRRRRGVRGGAGQHLVWSACPK